MMKVFYLMLAKAQDSIILLNISNLCRSSATMKLIPNPEQRDFVRSD
jgi:hypothetical protein